MSIEKTNAQMRSTCDELLSEYATYPMRRERWLSSDDIGPNDEPGYLAGPDVGPKPNYVYGDVGPNGNGYYHILTQHSYCVLYARLANEAPFSCCCFGSPRNVVDAWDTTTRILYNRSLASKPDDVLAAREVIGISQRDALSRQMFNAF